MMNNNFPKTVVGKIYAYGDKLVAPVDRKLVGVKHNGVLYRHRQMVTSQHETFVFDTTWARIRAGETEVETFKSTREPDELVPVTEQTPESVILQGYLNACICC